MFRDNELCILHLREMIVGLFLFNVPIIILFWGKILRSFILSPIPSRLLCHQLVKIKSPLTLHWWWIKRPLCNQHTNIVIQSHFLSQCWRWFVSGLHNSRPNSNYDQFNLANCQFQHRHRRWRQRLSASLCVRTQITFNHTLRPRDLIK